MSQPRQAVQFCGSFKHLDFCNSSFNKKAQTRSTRTKKKSSFNTDADRKDASNRPIEMTSDVILFDDSQQHRITSLAQRFSLNGKKGWVVNRTLAEASNKAWFFFCCFVVFCSDTQFIGPPKRVVSKQRGDCHQHC